MQSVSPGVCSGYYAISAYTAAELFHTEITLSQFYSFCLLQTLDFMCRFQDMISMGSHPELSTSPDRSVSILSDTYLIAVYRNSSTPPPPTQSVINMITVNSENQTITGYYATLWVGGTMTQSCFSPCMFFVDNGGSYQVMVSDYSGVSFSHWSDGVTSRLHDVSEGSTSTEVNLTVVYTP